MQVVDVAAAIQPILPLDYVRVGRGQGILAVGPRHSLHVKQHDFPAGPSLSNRYQDLPFKSEGVDVNKLNQTTEVHASIQAKSRYITQQ